MEDYQYGDAWRREEAVRLHSYEPPASAIDDYSGECVCLKINVLWVPFLTGVLDILTNRALWIDDTDDTIQQILLLIDTLQGTETTMTCEAAITSITFEGGVLKFTQGGDVFEVAGTEEIVTGLTAAGGIVSAEQGGEFAPVEDEDPCGDCNYPEKPVYDEDKSGEERACAIAMNMTEWFMEKYQDFLDQAEVGSNIVDVVQAAIKLVFPPAYLVFAPALELCEAFIELGIASSRAADTVEWREELAQALYCFIRTHDDQLEASDWIEFRDDWIDSNAVPVLVLYFDTFEPDAVEDQSHKQSYGALNECELFDCDTCIQKLFNFTETGFYTIIQGTLEDSLTVHGNVVRDNEDGTAAHEAIVQVTFVMQVPAIPVSNVKFEWYAESALGTEDTDRDVQVWVETNDGSGWVTRVDNLNHNKKEQTWSVINVAIPSSPNASFVRVKWRTGWGASDNAGGFIRIDDVCVT